MESRKSIAERPTPDPNEEIRQEIHTFFEVLSTLLDAIGFDRFARRACRKYWRPGTRNGCLRPETYFRLILYGYLMGSDSPRQIAEYVTLSRLLRDLIGYGPLATAPHRSSIVMTRQRIPVKTHERVLTWALSGLKKGGLEKTLQESTWLPFRFALNKLRFDSSAEACRAFALKLAENADQ